MRAGTGAVRFVTVPSHLTLYHTGQTRGHFPGAYWLVETVPAGNGPVDPVAVVVGLGSAPKTGDTDTISVTNKPKGSPKG